ncbi:cell wall-binding repeat-containing protein [Agromyces sp. NPDC057679]|uniref:cell wall-binding repeat-containing protein n=1 Tax=Agromyces sp. NPDC057679 TaxID=3346207 RepID=UPI0036715568
MLKTTIVGIITGAVLAASFTLPAAAEEVAAEPTAQAVGAATLPASVPEAGDDTVDERSLYEAHLAEQAAKAGDEAPGDAAAAAERQVELDATASDAAVDGQFSATAASPFTAGNLISNANFRNGAAMTEAEIQAFLQRMVGTCASSSCLARLKMDTPTRTWSFGTCATYPGARGESAARVIYKVQRACGLSAKVILVTLQKEQSLLTDPAPTSGVLRKAMGYGCPDTASCDSTYYGFFNQVFAAARQLTWYGNPGGSFTWIKVGQANRIQYNPATSCGSSLVTVKNAATAALYYYTPYQPNAAALANLYGTGDGCSAYGNRNFWRMYRDWFGDPRVDTAIPVTRLEGEDRYQTAASISRASFPTAGVPVAYLASGGDFADALSAAPAAAKQGGPLLLTLKSSVPASTLAELKRLKPKQIVVVGGTGVISNGVASAVGAVAPVSRIGGTDRYDTSRRLADHAFDTAAVAYIATGRDYPDGLTAGAAAGSIGAPVVLLDGRSSTVDAATRSLLDALGVGEVRIAGGTGVVSSGVQSKLAEQRTVKRYAGADRYATGVAVNSIFATSANAFVATGLSYPDALSGAAAAGRAKQPLYLTRGTCVPSAVRAALLKQQATSLTLLGGPGALSDRVARLVLC